eukprot:946525-Alexandrium_andersonii.AAC.1
MLRCHRCEYCFQVHGMAAQEANSRNYNNNTTRTCPEPTMRTALRALIVFGGLRMGCERAATY